MKRESLLRVVVCALNLSVFFGAAARGGEAERPRSEAAIQLAPVSVVPPYRLDQTQVIPGFRIETSGDLISWTSTGDHISGGVVESVPEVKPRISPGVRDQYFRLVELGIELPNADLSGRSLVRAAFSGANLRGANLSFADLGGADLSGADLTGANLTGADLRGADLQDANLTGADLRGANLIGVELSEEQTENAKLDSPVSLPAGEDISLVDRGFGLPAFDASGFVLGGGGNVSAQNLGFSTGGAKDINNFRDNIVQGYLPLVTDVTYEGLFYDYFFDTGQTTTCEDLFCPSYQFAASTDPLSEEAEYFLSVGLNSGISEAEFSRKHLNLVIVLDVSGSMRSPFNRYYYDRFGRQELDEAEQTQSKMEVANQSVVALLDHLEAGDRLAIVTFNNNASIAHTMTKVGDTDMAALRSKVLDFRAGGGTNMSAGMSTASKILDDFVEADRREFENRIIFLTDAQPNRGLLDPDSLLGLVRSNAESQTYASLIGIGVDFNTELVELILKTRGANYYAVHSPSQFKERMDDGFDFMVTPLVFDLNLQLTGGNLSIAEVYGSPEADEVTGDVMKVKTLFPSRMVDGETRGGLILLRLASPPYTDGGIGTQPVKLSVSYEDRLGQVRESEVTVEVPAVEPDFYANSGIRKGVLLSRYARLLRAWIQDERISYEERKPVVEPSPFPVEEEWWKPIVCFDCPQPNPELGRWERQSAPLFVSRPYRMLFDEFLDYFAREATALGDEALQQEVKVLERLSSLPEIKEEEVADDDVGVGVDGEEMPE